MIDKSAEIGEDGRTRLAQQCDEARALVAAAPEDEEGAEALFATVRALAREFAGQEQETRPRIAPEVAEAARLLSNQEDERAELILRRYIASAGNDPDAMLLMADIAARSGFAENAEKILRRSVEIDPKRTANWVALAKLLHDRARNADQVELVSDCLACLDQALVTNPDHEEALAFKATLLVQIRRLHEGETAFARLVKTYPASLPAWINYAHLLKTLGRFGEAVAAYRTAIALDPHEGAAWWLFADLKLARFFPADIRRMEEGLRQAQRDLSAVNFHFALAAAYHQAKDYENAARHLRSGNSLRLEMRPHDMEAMKRGVDAALATYSAQFFVNRAGAGDPSNAPIFVVGLPRSGSTLVEQILASHSQIEGTAELFAVQQIEMELFQAHETLLIETILPDLDRMELQQLGRRYLDLTRFHRRTDRERFIDKNPGNWRQIGLIHAILPNAHIIDIRRNPLDCCLANYSQHFMLGVNYSYGLEEVASQYREYLRLMRHFDSVLPDKIHHLIYDDLVEDLEGEVRRLLAYLDVRFEDSCLRFFDTDRPVHTPSSEQVRQPINRAGLGRWAKYEPWLPELRDALGSAVADWRH